MRDIVDRLEITAVMHGEGMFWNHEVLTDAAAEIRRLRAGLERARTAIQTLSARIPPSDWAGQNIVTEELKLATQALHPH